MVHMLCDSTGVQRSPVAKAYHADDTCMCGMHVWQV
jgi:hypothetical protein